MPDYTGFFPFKIGDILTDYSSIAVEVRAIASGGFGLVAFGPEVGQYQGRWLALKMVRPDMLRRSPHVRDLFIRESLTWCGVWQHANVINAHFVANINGLLMLVLDYADQGDLRRHLRTRFAPEQAITWAQHIAAGLAYLHTPDPDHLRPDPIIHRDLKPENILVATIFNQPFACITDFGLAKTLAAVAEAEAMGEDENEADEGTTPSDGTKSQRISYRTRRGSAVGTPAYMAPEQWEDAATARKPADAYAVGLILGELLIGNHPLLSLAQPHSQGEWYQAHCSGLRHPLPTIYPLSLHHLYAALLAPDPTQRPTMPEAFAGLQALVRQMQMPIYTVSEVVPPTTENQVLFWQSWANAYEHFNEHAEALVRNDQAYALAPHDPSVLSSRGTILTGMRRTEEALQMYAASLAVYPPEDHQGRAVVLNQRGVLFNETQRYAEAEEAYAAALREMPNAATTWRNRAKNLREGGEHVAGMGEQTQAREYFQQAFVCACEAWRLNPQDQDTPGTLARIGAALFAIQIYAEAEAAYALALEGTVDQEDIITWYNRAMNQAKWGAGEVLAGQEATGHEHLRAALSFALEAQRRGLTAPQLPALIAQIQAALGQAQG